jgi:hypothetical protein
MAKSSSRSKAPSDFVGMLDYYLVKKSPVQLPVSVKEFIVKFGPWIDLVVIVLMLPAALAVFGVATITGLWSAGESPAAGGLYFWGVLMLVQLGLMVLALPGLFNRQMRGWRLAFYAMVFNFITSMLTFQWVGGVVSLVVTVYVLFQVRSYYK